MNFVRPRDFVATKAWDAQPIAEIAGATVRLHWTDRPYIWREATTPRAAGTAG